MISLALAGLRLALVIAALIAVPGWLASGVPIRPWRPLHVLIVGTGIHFVALVLVSFLVARVTPALWLVPPTSLLLAVVVRPTARRLLAGTTWEPPSLGWRSGLGVAAIVAVAATLRWLHNYHFDDLAHLVYLTEVRREGLLFPSQFLIELTRLTLPLAGRETVMLSRYPFWAVSYTVLGRTALVSAGDAYFLLGLGLLSLILAQTMALVARGWSERTGLFWGVMLLAASPFVSDNLLNFGGYPFQSGKLFVLLAGTAIVVAWRTGEPAALLSAAVGLFVAPLLHTNNAVGVSGIVLLLLVMSVVVPAMRRATALVLLSVVLLGVTGVGSLVTRGFIRIVPTVAAGPASAAPAPTEASASVAAATAPPPRVIERLRLFASRGIPTEIVAMLLAFLIAPWLSRYQQAGDRAAPYALLMATLMLGAVCAVQLGRQLVTVSLKPGYLVLRSSLRELGPSIDGTLPLVTDPVTDVFGRAAGWDVQQPLETLFRPQSRLLLLLHPDVTGPALTALASSLGTATVVVNERVVGPDVASKLQRAAFRQLARAGPAHGVADDVGGGAADVVRALRQRAAGQALTRGFTLAASIGRTLGTGRPIVAFRTNGPSFSEPDYGELGALLRTEQPGLPQSRPFLNSLLVTLVAPAGCASGLRMQVVGLSSFDTSMLVRSLDAPRVLYRANAPLWIYPGRRTVTVPFERELCNGGATTFFVHSGYWWDARFSVESIEWMTHQVAQ